MARLSLESGQEVRDEASFKWRGPLGIYQGRTGKGMHLNFSIAACLDATVKGNPNKKQEMPMAHN